MLKKGLQSDRPIKVLQEVENMKGAVVGALSSSDLPCDRQQLYNLKYFTKCKDENKHSGKSLPLIGNDSILLKIYDILLLKRQDKNEFKATTTCFCKCELFFF